MQVRIGIFGHVIVEDDIDSFDVHATSKQIRSNKDPLLEIFELLIPGQAFLLRHPAMNSDGWEILLAEKLGKCDAPLNWFHENDHLK